MNTNESECSNRIINSEEFRTMSSASLSNSFSNGKLVTFSLETNGRTDNDDLNSTSGYQNENDYDEEKMEDENDITLDENTVHSGLTDYSSSVSFTLQDFSSSNNFSDQKSHNNSSFSAHMSNNNFSLLNSYCHSMPQLYTPPTAAPAGISLHNQALLGYFNPQQQYHHVNTYANNMNFANIPVASTVNPFFQNSAKNFLMPSPLPPPLTVDPSFFTLQHQHHQQQHQTFHPQHQNSPNKESKFFFNKI